MVMLHQLHQPPERHLLLVSYRREHAPSQQRNHVAPHAPHTLKPVGCGLSLHRFWPRRGTHAHMGLHWNPHWTPPRKKQRRNAGLASMHRSPGLHRNGPPAQAPAGCLTPNVDEPCVPSVVTKINHTPKSATPTWYVTSVLQQSACHTHNHSHTQAHAHTHPHTPTHSLVMRMLRCAEWSKAAIKAVGIVPLIVLMSLCPHKTVHTPRQHQ